MAQPLEAVDMMLSSKERSYSTVFFDYAMIDFALVYRPWSWPRVLEDDAGVNYASPTNTVSQTPLFTALENILQQFERVIEQDLKMVMECRSQKARSILWHLAVSLEYSTVQCNIYSVIYLMFASHDSFYTFEVSDHSYRHLGHVEKDNDIGQGDKVTREHTAPHLAGPSDTTRHDHFKSQKSRKRRNAPLSHAPLCSTICM